MTTETETKRNWPEKPQYFKPGTQEGANNAYAKYLSTLSPEEYEKHLEERKLKRSSTSHMRKTVQERWNETVLLNSEKLNLMLQQAAQSVLQRAIERGDPVAFNAVTDRILGKVAQTMTVNVKEQDTEQDILKQIQAVALSNMEKQLSNNVKHDDKNGDIDIDEVK